VKVDNETFRRRALQLVAESGRGVAGRLASELGVSRALASKRLLTLIDEGVLSASGKTHARVLRLRPLVTLSRAYSRAGLDEDLVWRDVFRGAVSALPSNVRDIWQYGVSEMVNNAVDHSGSERIEVGVSRDALGTHGWVRDTGEGIFAKIQRALDLLDPREAILELAKGKLTTDPVRHSGEGIFFSSRVFDVFTIHSGALAFVHDQALSDSNDWLIERSTAIAGTEVSMRLANDSTRTSKSVFDEFAAPEEYTFSKTVVPVRLAQHEGEKLLSRSQAKRLSARFERFRNVVLDFAAVVEIGQGFADELFRVFAQAHPLVQLTPIHMTRAVEQMVARARAHGASSAG
jgi:anti-sigma regulatory factor (Ser/Thr protein kinase)